MVDTILLFSSHSGFRVFRPNWILTFPSSSSLLVLLMFSSGFPQSLWFSILPQCFRFQHFFLLPRCFPFRLFSLLCRSWQFPSFCCSRPNCFLPSVAFCLLPGVTCFVGVLSSFGLLLRLTFSLLRPFWRQSHVSLFQEGWWWCVLIRRLLCLLLFWKSLPSRIERRIHVRTEIRRG